ncbi:Nramp family divalent metal transporter [uncultured Corynebacterium sp.]|uniref:Nramp family divalent metal transporter n=1 Tax=uncultured Corynebacterium sp. TaxID=159447 RepID=UPI0028062BDE|nr:Nramp family divalent metal transporter [uncultured Corynebacterium sp.]
MSQTSESSSARLAEGMHDTGSTDQTKVKWTLAGPGLVAAATGVGAADLVATMIAGQRYGYALLWAVIIGTIMKIVLVESVGRYSLATGNTMFHGWREMGL